MRIRQSIPRLHPGQIFILVLVGAIAVALLLPVRRHAAGARQGYGEAASHSQQELDSLNDLSGPPLHHDYPDNPLAREAAAMLDSNRQARRLAMGSDTIRLDRQRLKLELRHEDMVARRVEAAVA